MAVFFNGRLWTSPATMSAVSDSEMYDRNLSVGNVLAILGKSEGGPPASILKFSRFGAPSQARDVLFSGEALKAIEKAFDPSSETSGPSEIVFIRVNPATQSTLVLKDVGNANVIDLVSTDYGLRTIGVRIKIEAGTSTGKKVSTAFGNDYYTKDNVVRNAFSAVYTGANGTATIDITGTTVVLTDASTTTIDLLPLVSIGDLVDRINNVPGWAAAVLDGNESSPVLWGLDGISGQNAKTTAYNAQATLQAIIDFINSAGEGFVTATRSTGGMKVPVNVGWTYLTGGSEGTTTNQSWQDAFDVLQTIDCQWVVPISDSSAVHAMADTHVAYMSNIGRMERRAIVGGALGLTDDQAMTAAKALNSDRTSYVHLGFYDYNSVGALTLYSPFVLAGLLGGMMAGVNPGTALTNKPVKVKGLERRLRNPTDTDQLLNGGCLVCEDTTRGFKVVQSITTWLVNNNFNRREMSVGAAVDFVSRNVRDALDILRGRKANPLLLTQAISITETALKELAKPEPMGPGVLVGDLLHPAFKNITASIEADVLRVEFQVSPVISINYIPVVIYCVPWHGSATI